KSRNSTYNDLRSAIEKVAFSKFVNRAHLEGVLERLLSSDSVVQRDQFWQRTECLLSYQQDAALNTSLALESSVFLGVGEKIVDSAVKTQIAALLGTNSERIEPVPIDFKDELVYLKTFHGLPITLVHGV